ncbi:MAG: NfeD family protein [Kangiellaceae bacterium]|nr:NfeD family protein [Kangiellaceae bacterium]MCW8997578.1 NfeD family protein [Kangiellaceae bacterium]
MLELFLFIALLVGLAFLGAFDFLIPHLDKLSLKLGLQEEPRTKENLGSLKDSLVGSIVIVESDFVKSQVGNAFEGRVKARGTGWRAEQLFGDKPLLSGSKAVVKRIEGNKLFVEVLDIYQDE